MLKRLKIGPRILVSFGLVFLLYAITMCISLFSISSVGEKLDNFYNKDFSVVNTAWNVRLLMTSAEKNIFSSVTDDNPQNTANFLKLARKNLEDLEDANMELNEKFTGDPALLETYNQAMKKAKPVREQLINSIAGGYCTIALQTMNKEYLPLMKDANSALDQISAIASDSAKTAVDGGAKIRKQVVVTLLVFSIANLVVIAFITLALTKGIVKPLSEIEKAAHELAKGNLQKEITYSGSDEVGMLAQSMRETIEKLKLVIENIGVVLGKVADCDLTAEVNVEYAGDFAPVKEAIEKILCAMNSTMHQIEQASGQVAGGSNQVSGGAQALSQGATEQASAIQQLAASINEVSEQVKVTASGTNATKELVHITGDALIKSNQQMQVMLGAMENINSSSKEIGKIIKTIDDFAFQTNILALNAAVEAARAGQAGKGFAVVADEVRRLASKSAEAAKDTADLIEKSMKQVAGGTKTANETAKSLQYIVENTKKITGLVNEISAASTEEAAAITQITRGIEQISSVVQTNSATAEESAAASEELNGQAQLLKGLVKKFSLKKADVKDEVCPEEPSDEEAEEIITSLDQFEAKGDSGKYHL
ncbi:methyl-accepting chemotaxis protein [Hydrogenoanaerobacterium sp.]|uniref:methyl-accepting chemotaxis protein n=1 Tax=Hydrogenoanaerobacterium sp. TaxID=2953763 RepID=UPI002897BB66|nr:methyl-accepting chemotaxis protein [Hydrogenoanaerobacterium sp.]